jgi:hypothetical protein
MPKRSPARAAAGRRGVRTVARTMPVGVLGRHVQIDKDNHFKDPRPNKCRPYSGGHTLLAAAGMAFALTVSEKHKDKETAALNHVSFVTGFRVNLYLID